MLSPSAPDKYRGGGILTIFIGGSRMLSPSAPDKYRGGDKYPSADKYRGGGKSTKIEIS